MHKHESDDTNFLIWFFHQNCGWADNLNSILMFCKLSISDCLHYIMSQGYNASPEPITVS